MWGKKEICWRKIRWVRRMNEGYKSSICCFMLTVECGCANLKSCNDCCSYVLYTKDRFPQFSWIAESFLKVHCDLQTLLRSLKSVFQGLDKSLLFMNTSTELYCNTLFTNFFVTKTSEVDDKVLTEKYWNNIITVSAVSATISSQYHHSSASIDAEHLKYLI